MNLQAHFKWRSVTTYVAIIGAVLVLIALVASFVATNFKPTTSVGIAGANYQLWVADTLAEREQGLSGVTSLPKNGGMLFVFETERRWGIWMKDMQIPIDIVWLDADKKVVHIEPYVDPELDTNVTFLPDEAALYVIELASGEVDKAGIKVGQIAQFAIGEASQ